MLNAPIQADPLAAALARKARHGARGETSSRPAKVGPRKK
jgi:hypothetical protein